MFEFQEIQSFNKLQYAFMSMEGAAIPWFYFWSQENQDSNWQSFSTALMKRLKDSYDSHVFERVPTLEQEEQTKRETHIKEVVALKKQEPKPRLDGSSKKKAFRKEAPNSCGLHHRSCKASVLELKH